MAAALDVDDDSALLRKLAVVLLLPRQVHEDLQQSTDDPSMAALVRQPLEELDEVIGRLTDWGGNQTLSVVTRDLTPLVRHALKMADAQIRTAGNARTRAGDDEVAGLLQQVGALMTDVLESQLPVDFKSFLLRHLASIRQALEDVAITGLGGIEAAVERAVGGMVMTGRHAGPKDEDGEGGRGWWARFMGVVRDANALGQASQTGIQVGEAVGQWQLPPGFGG